MADKEVRAAKSNQRAISLLMKHMEVSKKNTTRSLPVEMLHDPDKRVARFTLDYLSIFGYLKEELVKWKDISLEDIVSAVKTFQSFFGLGRSGKITNSTVRAMEMPRCGCPDIVRKHQLNFVRATKFVRANLAKWKKTDLVYGVAAYVPGFSKPDFDQLLAQAFGAWTQYGNINARLARTGERADILIGTGSGPQSNFDGAGGVLAWAYLPDGNDQQLTMKFDLGETWVLTPQQRGILIANVAKHEFGHLFGLDHSRVQAALMAPYYNAGIGDPQQNDDIPRFQARYGVRTTPTTPTTPGVTSVDIKGNARVTLNGVSIA